MFRHALRALLAREPGFEVVAEAASGDEVLAIAAAQPVDLVCMDIAMPGMNGIDATRRRNRSLSGVLSPPAPTRNNPSHFHEGGVGSDQGDSDQQQVAAP